MVEEALAEVALVEEALVEEALVSVTYAHERLCVDKEGMLVSVVYVKQ